MGEKGKWGGDSPVMEDHRPAPGELGATENAQQRQEQAELQNKPRARVCLSPGGPEARGRADRVSHPYRALSGSLLYYVEMSSYV